MNTKRKIWIGIGAFVVAGTGAWTPGVGMPTDTAIARAPTGKFLLAQHTDHVEQADKPSTAEAGEGGESKGIEGLPADLAFAARLALLRGHLLVGDELVKQQQWNAALPHFLHPSEEIYGDIKDALAEYNVQPFEAALKTLANLVKTKKGGNDYTRALKTVGDAVVAADAALRNKQADQWASFVAEAAIESIKVAAGEYENALVGNRIAKPVEYQDARGFIWESERMIQSVAAALQKKDAAAFNELRARIAELKKVFPTAMPPRTPVKDYGAVLALISRIELVASRLM